MLQNLHRWFNIGKENSSSPKLPHNCKNIIQAEDSSSHKGSGAGIGSTSQEEDASTLLGRLQNGVFLNNKRRKYWVEEKSLLNCFMIYTRDLSITWAHEPRYWSWPCVIEKTSKALVEVAELVDVCWLEVAGYMEVSHLTPHTLYEVVFVVMLKGVGYGWEVPVNLQLQLPSSLGNNNVTDQNRQLKLSELPKAKWIGLRVGQFKTPSSKANSEGELVQFCVSERGGHWKRGLVIKGVLVRPKNHHSKYH